MKKWYVYEIVNLMGTVEYVGETTMPKQRMANHKSSHKGNGTGRFSNRSDVFMNIVKEFDTKSDAFEFQCKLQNEYGFINDRNKHACNTSYRPPNIILQFDLNGNFIKEFPSLCNAARELSIPKQLIRAVIVGNQKKTHGYTFKYKIVK